VKEQLILLRFLLLIALLAGGCGKKAAVTSPGSPPEPKVDSIPESPADDGPDPSLMIQEALEYLVLDPEIGHQRSVDLLNELLAAEPDSSHRDQAELILALIKRLEQLEEDLKGREAAVQELSEELELLKEIILREKKVRPPRY
jgi:hypothetical protein